MNELVGFVSETRWAYVATMIVIWVVVWGGLELVFFDGNVVSAVISGAAGGLASGAILYSVNRESDR
ncbi:hypothetical protein [Halopelagius longus]|uniref:Uncharacterized protein n=1 Tax=Halopelagius longus TaxID=1236180 RepID=A0A1H1BU74_9EURY|nr:hypothetical protein [Halopelagius longus]RDI70927.1 hypothetical protein DWB78_03835 [Halopelagius longus]SDQ55493.1 hypothetical protein SAMN05216278_1956 [Halopelagius longus]